MEKKFNKKLITKIAIADLLIFAASINIFAYFDHVRGWGDDTPVPDFSFLDSSNDGDENSDLFNPGNSGTSQVPDNSEDNNSSDKNNNNDNPAQSSPFTDGEVISEGNIYKSKYVSIELKEITYNNKLYMVQDIYIKRIESLGAGFAKGLSPLSGEKSTIFEMVQHYRNNNYNIIGAVNGDYCGYNSKGATIRNGVLYGKGVAQFDVCVVYKDGTMVTMEPEDFNAQTELEKGAWQVWDFGPTLLDGNGKAISDFSDRRDINGTNPRTAIGYYEPGHYCFVVAGGRGKQAYGVKLSELSGFMESIGCKTAYNLDGGRSSIMVYGEKIVNEPYQDVTRRNTDMVFIQDFFN